MSVGERWNRYMELNRKCNEGINYLTKVAHGDTDQYGLMLTKADLMALSNLTAAEATRIKRDLDRNLEEAGDYANLTFVKAGKIKFKYDFAGNWRAGDIVDIKLLDEEAKIYLVDNIAKISADRLEPVCKLVTDSFATADI